MENVHNAIAWYQKKIGSYDKQLWEQSVEKKLQKQPPFVLHNAPRKKVRLKTEYIDVDLIRGSTFTKTKPQVPWVYVTRKAISRVLFFPFYYNWWATQTSKKLYAVLLVLYVLQVLTVIVYLRNFDHSIMEDELSFTEVILPSILMFLMCLIHSQTVLAHINHKPPKRTKSISGVTRKPKPKKTSRKGRSSGNNSTCPEDGGNTDTSKSPKLKTSCQQNPSAESHMANSIRDAQLQKNRDPPSSPSIDMTKNLMSRTISDYDLKPATVSTQQSTSSSHHHNHYQHHHKHHHSDLRKNEISVVSSQSQEKRDVKQSEAKEDVYNVHSIWGDGKEASGHAIQKSGCSYNLLDNLPNLLTVEKVCRDVTVQRDTVEEDELGEEESSKREDKEKNLRANDGRGKEGERCCNSPDETDSHICVKIISKDRLSDADNKRDTDILKTSGCVDSNGVCDVNRAINPLNKCKSGSKYTNSDDVDETLCAITQNTVADKTSSTKVQSKDDADHCIQAINVTDLGIKISAARSSGFSEESRETVKDVYSSQDSTEQPILQGAQDILIDYPSGSDYPSSSDFEMVEQHQVPDDGPALSMEHGEAVSSKQSGAEDKKDPQNSMQQLVHNRICETCSSSQTGKCECEHANSFNVQMTGADKSHILSSMRAESSRHGAQDSFDSGINNESPISLCDGGDPQPNVTHFAYDETGDKRKVESSAEDTALVSAPSACINCQSSREYVRTAATSHCDSSMIDGYAHQRSSVTCNGTSTHDTSAACNDHHVLVKDICSGEAQSQPCGSQSVPQILVRAPSLPREHSSHVTSHSGESCVSQKHPLASLSESSSQLQCFSELFVQEILNEDTLREISCSSLLAHSDLENSSSSLGQLSTASAASSGSTSSSSCRMSSMDHIPVSSPSSVSQPVSSGYAHHKFPYQQPDSIASRRGFTEKIMVKSQTEDKTEDKNNPLDESLDQINLSDPERPSDDVSNYNPSDSDADSDGPLHEDLRNRCEEKWKRLRFQELTVAIDGSGSNVTPKASPNGVPGTSSAVSGTSTSKGMTTSGNSLNGPGSRGVMGILTRKPSPLKDLTIGRKMSSSAAGLNSSGSDQEQNEARNQLRRRRRASGTPAEVGEPSRSRNVPNSLGLRPTESNTRHLSSSENETGGGHTPEGSNKATVSSEEWEDRMQSDETTSSAYSSSCGNSEVETDERGEEEKTEYTTSTLHVINLLQPGLQPSCPQSPQQSGSPTSSGNVTQPDKVSCVIWEGNECKKVDLTALDIGWAIIDKVDSIPESSDYFLIGFMFSVLMSLVPLVFRAYANKELANWEELLTWSDLGFKLLELPALLCTSYSWRQYLVMINGILQRFILSLIFFFLLSVADRTFKQRLLYAKHFSYLTSSRRARKFSMPHFRLNKVRNIKIWLSLRSYLKRRGPQRSVDVIVSACFMCAVCTVCLISLQMLKDTESYLDYLCNWELLVWCVALGVFIMRFMTVGLKINKKYRNLSVLITEQINLYLQMEQKPHKKEELILANNVLRLAEDLLKELENPFKISGFSANPLIYNIMRVVILSAFSAVLTEVLGFKLKLHKIKLKG